MSFPISGAGKRTASTGKVFGENTGTRVRMIFPETCKARPCGWKRAVPLPLPLNWNGSALFPLPSLGLGEREFQVEVRVKGYRGVERGPFLALDPLDQPGGAGREKLFQMLVGQLLVSGNGGTPAVRTPHGRTWRLLPSLSHCRSCTWGR